MQVSFHLYTIRLFCRSLLIYSGLLGSFYVSCAGLFSKSLFKVSFQGETESDSDTSPQSCTAGSNDNIGASNPLQRCAARIRRRLTHAHTQEVSLSLSVSEPKSAADTFLLDMVVRHCLLAHPDTLPQQNPRICGSMQTRFFRGRERDIDIPWLQKDFKSLVAQSKG